mgnify:CR=1 FL=1
MVCRPQSAQVAAAGTGWMPCHYMHATGGCLTWLCRMCLCLLVLPVPSYIQLRLMRMLRMLKLHAKVARLASAFSLEIGTIARLLQVLFWMVVRTLHLRLACRRFGALVLFSVPPSPSGSSPPGGLRTARRAPDGLRLVLHGRGSWAGKRNMGRRLPHGRQRSCLAVPNECVLGFRDRHHGGIR